MARVMAFLEIDSMAGFKARIHDHGLARSERARLAPLVMELTASGDAQAGAILEEAVDELRQLAVSVRRQLGLPTPDIIVCGGLSGHPHFQTTLADALYSEGMATAQARMPAATGAVLLALKSGGAAIDHTLLTRLNRRSHLSN
jgi:N-acetylglucosamine kinase-like BadF-type ATPase